MLAERVVRIVASLFLARLEWPDEIGVLYWSLPPVWQVMSGLAAGFINLALLIDCLYRYPPCCQKDVGCQESVGALSLVYLGVGDACFF